jgi:hypothetical protein
VSWWLVSAEQTLTDFVSADPKRVRDFYTNLTNLTLVHPLIVSVRRVAPQKWRVQDRIQFGPLAFRIWYSVRLEIGAAGEVIAEARQFPRVRVHSVVSFERVDDGTRVVERLRTIAPRPLAACTNREAVAAHAAMLAGIRRRFER